MSTLEYSWCESASLLTQLVVPVERASIRTAAHGRPITLTLWRHDGTGLRIRARMHDIADRIEIGVLDFSLADSADADETFVDLPSSFSGPIQVSRLIIIEAGMTAESGVVLETSDGNRIVVTAGANPYTLAVKGVVDTPHVFEPEYPLNRYSPRPYV